MKKNANLLLVFTLLSSTISSTLGCQFTFNDQEKVNSIANNKFAEQAAKVVEGFFFAHIRDADTDQTINDMLGEVDNLGIANSNIGPINNMADFKKYWGEDGKITFTGFEKDENNLIIASRKGTLTKEINKYNDQKQQWDKVKDYINYAKAIDSSILPGLIKKFWPEIAKKLQLAVFHEKIQNDMAQKQAIISDFLTAVQNLTTDNIMKITTFLEKKGQLNEPEKQTLKIINNKINNPDLLVSDDDVKTMSNFFIKIEKLDPPSRFRFKARNLTFLTKIDELNAKMVNVLDSYLINVSDSLANLKYLFYGEIPPLNGETISNYKDFNYDQKYAYAGGHILNRLFARISEDNKLKKDKKAQFVKRDLSGIIDDITYEDFEIPSFKPKKRLLSDFQQYSEKILQNPSYMIELVAALTPLIKHLLLNNAKTNNKISTTIKYLTLDYEDITTDTYSIKTMLTNLQSWLSGELVPLKTLLVNIINIDPKAGSLQFFLSDIIEKLASTTQYFIYWKSDKLVNPLIDMIKPVLGQFQEIAANIQNVIKIASDKNKKLKIRITTLIDQLTGKNQLFTIFNNIILDLKQKIMDPKFRFDEKSFSELVGNSNHAFTQNKLLWFMENCLIKNNDSILNNIFLLLLGNDKDGLVQNVIDYNTNLIHEKYLKYFSAKNKAISKVYHVQHHAKITNEFTIDYWQFNLNYTLDDKTFYFKINCSSKYDSNNNLGLRILQFREITVNSSDSSLTDNTI